MKIGHHLKKARESKRLSQHEVSELLGISQKTLSNIESGKTQPSVIHLSKMGEIYELDVLKLLSDNGIHLCSPPPRNLSEAEKELRNLKDTLERIIRKKFLSFREIISLLNTIIQKHSNSNSYEMG